MLTLPLSLSLVGGVVPPSLVDRIIAGEVSDRSSLSARSYHLVGTETVRDAASRAWGYLRGAWVAWREHDAGQRVGAGTGPARERWLLPLLRELGYGQVPALPSGLSLEGTDYPVSHRWEHVPVHLLGPGVDLDRRNPGVSGAARAPQSMLQELLNRSDEHLWALLSNGLRLRLLRDSTSLAGSAHVEFDLEAIFEGELYAEWLLLFQLCHVSRVEKRGGAEASPSDCWLESWRGEAVEAGGRALDKLRWGVERALDALGEGFLSHRDNRWLVVALRSGELSDRDLHRALLRLVYRMLFVFVAEDRDLLLVPGQAEGRDRYERFFSTSRLRHLARVRAGGPHADMWQAQRLVLSGLGGDGVPQLALPALGGVFDPDWRAVVPAAAPDQQDLLLGAELSNQHFLKAIRALAWVESADGRLQRVDYRNLGAEELGSVYESLLELVPSVNLDERSFTLTHLSGNERKTTGSYYTPPGLVSALLDTALDPVIDDALRGVTDPEEAERRLLALTVCDPACGSGGFLVAAARRIAQRLARVRCGDDEPTPAQVHHAMRDVVGRCIYGVDLNDLAAELAKVSLWLEAMEPGKPLGFLDARIRVGNALLGTTPALLAGGVPEVAFKELLGDDRTYAAQIRKRNRAEGGGQDLLFSGAAGGTAELAAERQRLIATTDDIDASRRQEQAWAQYEQSAALRHRRLHADAWCAAFVWPLKPGAALPPTNAVLRQLEQDPTDPGLEDTVAQVQDLTHQYQFFHWHLEFPEVFGDPTSPDPHGPEGWPGGFTCVLGNPPFLNRLESKTALSDAESSLLRGVLGDAVRPYTDVSALFLLRGVQLVSAGGRLAMVQPQSLLATRDAANVRQAVLGLTAMTDLWASEVPVFDASVITCAVSLHKGARQGRVGRLQGPSYVRTAGRDLVGEGGAPWSPLLSRSLGLPDLELRPGGTVLGQFAKATADFRDQYYGLFPYVREMSSGALGGGWAPLVTTGLIDPAECKWGAVETRFAKKKWIRPGIDLKALRVGNAELSAWADSRLMPKILMATQGKVLEAVVDPSGQYIPSVPVITVTCSPELVWHVASVLLSPVASLYAATNYAGAGLTMTSIKLSAKQVTTIPWPDNGAYEHLDAAAQHVQLAHAAGTHEAREQQLILAAEQSCKAFGVASGDVIEWWKSRAFARAKTA